ARRRFLPPEVAGAGPFEFPRAATAARPPPDPSDRSADQKAARPRDAPRSAGRATAPGRRLHLVALETDVAPPTATGRAPATRACSAGATRRPTPRAAG